MTVTRTALAVAFAAVASLVLVTVSAPLSYLVRSLTAVVAATMLLRLGVALGRTSRILLGTALLAGIASGVAATAHVLVTGELEPAGGIADWLYLSYVPLAAAGLLALPRHATDARDRLLAVTDALVAVAGLGLLIAKPLASWARESGTTTGLTVAVLGYPLGGVFVLAVLVSVMSRAREDLRPFLRTAGVAFAFLTASGMGYGVATLRHSYLPTSWPALCDQSALVLMALAPRYARRAVALVEREPQAPGPLEAAAPVLALVPAAALIAVMTARGVALRPEQMTLVSVASIFVIARGLLISSEQRRTVSRLRTREREATSAARCDPLTGLANRTALYATLAELLAGSAESGVVLALLDLDDFKDINDTHGHDTGDAVLREVAHRLVAALPSDALVARLGGDEFAVCVATTAGPHPLGQVLLGAFAAPVVVGARPFCVTASIGVVQADAHGADAAVALSHVDVAMYEAKAGKDPQRSGMVVLDGAARELAAARVQMRDDVSHPVLDQFHLVYEPMVDLSDGTIVGAEALLRWEHPTLGSVSPTQFVALAEQVGAIAELGEFALRTAVADLAGWLRTAEQNGDPLDRGSIGVNLSPRQLGVPGLCDLVRSVLAEHRLHPYRLVLEITEQALMDDWATAVEVVQELRSIGVGVAVDDFGTGWSSLRYLRRFDTSTVKIDREFTQAVADEPRTRVLVASVIEMARSLDLYSVAEGIETLDQLDVLRTLGCRFAQGYLFDKPMSAERFGALLIGRHRYPLGAHPRSATIDIAGPREGSRPREVVPASAPVIPRQTG